MDREIFFPLRFLYVECTVTCFTGTLPMLYLVMWLMKRRFLWGEMDSASERGLWYFLSQIRHVYGFAMVTYGFNGFSLRIYLQNPSWLQFICKVILWYDVTVLEKAQDKRKTKDKKFPFEPKTWLIELGFNSNNPYIVILYLQYLYLHLYLHLYHSIE